jgi:hypothetical protein
MIISTMVNIRRYVDSILLKLRIRHIVTALRSLRVLELDLGHSLSSRSYESVDGNNKPVPWITYPAINYIENLELKNKEVFEYGCGNSTLYFAKRSKRIVSVENNLHWYKKIKEKSKKYNNLFLEYKNNEKSYSRHIRESSKKFDLILIDGMFRFACTKEAVKKLNTGGIILVDNIDRYPNICSYLKSKGFTQIDMKGFNPINYYLSTTAIFFKNNINFRQVS